MFQTAQWAASSEAALALAQMAARGATQSGARSAGTRAARPGRGMAEARWTAERLAWSGPEKRNAKAEEENLSRLAAIDRELREIDRKLRGVPRIRCARQPAPLAVEEVQAQIRPDEALVLFFDTRGMETHARRDVYLGRNEDGCSLGAQRTWHAPLSRAKLRRSAAGSTLRHGTARAAECAGA